LLDIPGYTGLKTGWTPGADGCLASSFNLRRNNKKTMKYISIVLGSSN